MDHPKNAAGDFYVEFDCCLSCDVPFEFAPKLFKYDENMSCYVSRQPANETELAAIIEVTENQELGCIRYRGNDASILNRIDPMFCDASSRPDTPDRPWWKFWRR